MAGKLYKDAGLTEYVSDKKAIKASYLQQTTLRAGNPITVWRQKVPSDKVYWFGAGSEENATAVARKYADLVASGNGAGTAGDAIEGNISVAITDSDGFVIRSREVGDLDSLRDAASAKRTERPPMPAYAPYASSDRYVEVRINADKASDGIELDPGASSARLWYSTSDA